VTVVRGIITNLVLLQDIFYLGETMAKRYHQSKKDRMHESRGMAKHNRDRFNDEERHEQDSRGGSMGFKPSYEPYAGSAERRHLEMQDAGMIHDDPSAIANLPQNVMIKAYPKTGPYLPEGLDDTIKGVDMQMDYDDSQRRSHFYPKKI
jgi:hypothetical protein